MRWLSLIAVLGGCTLITDPSSFEGDPIDAGRNDAADGALDGGEDARPDGGPPECMEPAMRPAELEVCFEGRWRSCDADGDGFPACDIPPCSVFDPMFGDVPCDCDEMDRARAPGIPMCGSSMMGCAPFEVPLGSAQFGEITVELPRAEQPSGAPPSLGLLVMGNRFGAVVLEECGASCGRVRKRDVVVSEGYAYSEDESVIAEGRYLASSAQQVGNIALVGTYSEIAGAGTLSIYQTSSVVFPPPFQINRLISPSLAIALAPPATGEPVAPALYGSQPSAGEISLYVDGTTRTNRNERGVVDSMPNMDAVGTTVVYEGRVGDAPRHLFWAAPPQALEDTASCFASDGCDPVPVGGSLGGPLTPNGRPSVVAGPTGAPVAVFPILNAGMPELIGEVLVPGCGPGSDYPAGPCPSPHGLGQTGGANVQETTTAGDLLLVAFNRVMPDGSQVVALNGYSIAALRGPPAGAPLMPVLQLPLMTDLGAFDQVVALRTHATLIGNDLQVGTLIWADDGLLLNVVRLCSVDMLPPT